jgi:hypothetical protein
MSIRSLNGLNLNTVRTLNGLDTDQNTEYTVSLPLTMDSDNNIKLSNLTSYGSANQILKMNSGATALEYAAETDTTYTAGTNINLNGTTINLDTTISLDGLNMNYTGIGGSSGLPILFKGADPNHYIKYINDGVEVGGWGSNDAPCFQIYSTGQDTADPPAFSAEVLASYYRGLIEFNKDLYMNDNTIYLHLVNGERDPNHYIKYVFDGVEIGGYGSGDAPCFSVVNTQPLNNTPPGTPIAVFQVYIDKVISKQNLNMTSKPIYFKENDVNHYIKYQSTGDCVELASYSDGTDDDVVFQFINKSVSSGNANLLLINKENNSFIKTTNFQSDVSIKNAKKIIFNDSSVITQSNYIKFDGTYDSMEISGSGLGGTASVLRIVSANATPTDVLANFELTKTTFEKTTHFNNDIQMAREKKLFFDVGLLSNNNWIKATSEDGQDGLNIQGSTGIKLTTETFSGELFLNQNTFEVSANLTTFDNDITATFCDISLDGDFNGTDCDLTIDGDMRIGQELNMRDNTNLGQINMADGPIYYRNGYKTGENTYATDTNHYSQYNSFPVDGIRHQGWNGVALGYTNGGPGTALYTSGGGVFLGNGSPVTSDDRIKFNETKITGDALTTINKLVVVQYDKRYNRDLPETQYNAEMENHLLNDTPQKEYGYIAQDTWNDIPELRFTIKGVDETIPENFDEEGKLIEDCKIRNKNPAGDEFIDRKYLSIDYNNINVLNVRAVQELSAIVKQQQEQINKQQEQINKQEEIINKLIKSSSFKSFKENL